MSSDSNTRIVCERPLDSNFADHLEAALSEPAIGVLLIEFQPRPETEKLEVDQILAADPLIDRLRNLIRQIEQGPKPVAALVTESIGGLLLDVAFACHVRFASSGTISLEYPWLEYGLMPILGGTQRLPRLCGIELAARLLLEARKVTISEMAASGLFEVKDYPLPEAAVEWAEAHAKKPVQPWDHVPQELSLTYSQTLSNRQLLEKIYLKLRRRVAAEEAAPAAILRCLHDGLERSMDAGLRLEAEQWSMVRRSRSTINRVKTLYVARQKTFRRTAKTESSIQRIGVLGAGLMGTGIGYTAARAGYEVIVVEVSHQASERSLQQMMNMARQDSQSGSLKEDASDLLTRVHWDPGTAALAPCDFIIEAIFERADLKKSKLAEIAALVDPAAIIASNTTTLPISDLASACHHPERFLGTHFFAPVDRMELLEIVLGEKTASETMDQALKLAKALKKTPIIVRDGPGFFTSRVVAAYLQEALFMVREGISPWTIDNVAQNAGMILGPLTVADLMSLDLLTHIFESLAQHQRGAARYASDSIKILRELASQSRFGRKSGAGIYDYNARRERVESKALHGLFAPTAHRSAPGEIEQRLFVIQTIEALHAMREGIVDDADIADLASVLGWSYPAARGGVLAYLDYVGREEFEQVRVRLQDKFGDRFTMPA
jgi:3-hydroxyacyl-CoA dehydrogenase/enoyl-CoA hydratase/3-hydroxybutyryl-CoA epimerase